MTLRLQRLGDHLGPGAAAFVPEAEFFVPSLEDAAPEKMALELSGEENQIEHHLLPVLRTIRLAVVGGPSRNEKTLLAKRLAWQLSAELEDEGKDCRVLQWHSQPSLVPIGEALDRQPACTIFLFVGLQPHHLGGYDLRRLVDQLANTGQYAIFTTDSELSQWSSAREWSDRGVWLDASRVRFDKTFLADALLVRLKEQADLPAGLEAPIDDLLPASPLVGGLRVVDVAAQLGTPSRVRSFALSLGRLDSVSEARVRELLEQVVDDRDAAQWWFRSLDTRRQLLALSLSLFDGLLDDQVFSALEILIHNAWRRWDPNLAQFDYHELPSVSAYFEGTRDLSRTASIECLSEACREALFEVGWELHRRRIVTVLPLLSHLVREAPDDGELSIRADSDDVPEPERDEASPDAAEGQAGSTGDAEGSDKTHGSDAGREGWRASRWRRPGQQRDLFGSAKRSRLFRQCVAGTLSRLARISLDAVEPTLLDLAQDDEQRVQLVAAVAVAMWRDLDPGGEGDRRLFALLDSWQDESFSLRGLDGILRRGDVERPFARVRATIALAVGRAALYDPPNHLHERLLRLVEKLLVDPDGIVRQRLHNETLPKLAAAHLRQVEHLLWDKAVPDRGFRVGIAVGIAIAHRLRPEEAVEVLEGWRRKAGSIPSNDPDEIVRRRRSHGLQIVAFACGLLVPHADAAGWSEERIFDVLGELLRTADDPEIRQAVLAAALQQMQRSPSRVGPWIQELVEELALEERDRVVAHLTRIYLEQRCRLHKLAPSDAPEPDIYEYVRRVRYPLWIDGERPATPVEAMLDAWIDDPLHPAALQIALAALAHFAETDLEKYEDELRRDRQAEIEDGAETEDLDLAPRVRLRRLSPCGYLAVVAASPWNAHRREILKAALPESLATAPPRPNALGDLLTSVWNEGEPRWHRLVEPETYEPLFRRSESDESPMHRRLRRSPDPSGQQLARYLARAEWLVRWCWLFWGTALVALAFVLVVLGLF